MKQNKVIDYQQFKIDNIETVIKSINENTSTMSGGSYNPVFLTGTIQRANAVNHNGRLYRKDILSKQIDEFITTKVNTNNALGELDHPEERDWISLQNVSHNIKKIWWDNDDVKAKIEILDTPAGHILTALIKSGINPGISSRGLGSFVNKKVLINGIEEYVSEIQDDYKLITFDFVTNPSTQGAFLKLSESESLTKSEIEKNARINEINNNITSILELLTK